MLSCIKLGVNEGDYFIIDDMNEKWCVSLSAAVRVIKVKGAGLEVISA